jgi:thymidylate synthase (FAD)
MSLPKNHTISLYDDNIGSVAYVEHMGSDLTIVNSARVSFGTQKEVLDNRDRKLINYLVSHKHTSTLEHNIVTMKFKVPLYVARQHHRHRTWSFNEISRRYTAIDMSFYQPQSYRTQHQSNRQASNADTLIDPTVAYNLSKLKTTKAVQEHVSESISLYNELVTNGVCREQARGILPQNMYTEYYGTVNLNNLFKFISLRNHSGAQWEIQQVAKACQSIIKELFPETFKAWTASLDVIKEKSLSS